MSALPRSIALLVLAFATASACLSDERLRIECSDPSDCPAGQECISQVCVDPADGGIEPHDALADACPPEAVCGGSCVDLASDNRHCGACGRACEPGVNETAACVEASCVRTCQDGYHDLDSAPGCEYACVFESRNDVCDGVDNDCDGVADSGASYVASACAVQAGVCSGSVQPCREELEVPCDEASLRAHSSSYQRYETLCDELDNDCDGLNDEGCCEDPVDGYTRLEADRLIAVLGVTGGGEAVVRVNGPGGTSAAHYLPLRGDESMALGEPTLERLCELDFRAQSSAVDPISDRIATVCRDPDGDEGPEGPASIVLADPATSSLRNIGFASANEVVTGWTTTVGGLGWLTLSSTDRTRVLTVQLSGGQASIESEDLGFTPSGINALGEGALIVGSPNNRSRALFMRSGEEPGEVPSATGFDIREGTRPLVWALGTEACVGLVQEDSRLNVWSLRRLDTSLVSVLRVDADPVAEAGVFTVGPTYNRDEAGCWFGTVGGTAVDGVIVERDSETRWTSSGDELPEGTPRVTLIENGRLSMMLSSSEQAVVVVELNERGQLLCRE